MTVTDHKTTSGRRFHVVFLLISFILAFFTDTFALPVEHYASRSVLSEGKWRKVRVNDNGMFFLSNSDLRTMGFTDPSKVKVYGYGGKMEPEALSSEMGDDLPLMPVVRTAKGIVFFGNDHFKWRPDGGKMKFAHVQNPYSEQSFYFLSDREGEDYVMPRSTAVAGGNGERTGSFICRLVHEKDLAAPSETGRMLLGEDFRTNTRQTFNFQLPGNTGSDVTVNTSFGAYTTGGSTSLMFTANGERLPSTSTDRISAVNSNQFLRTTSTVKTVADAGDRLAFAIECSYSGAIFTARLDYIEVEYERELKLDSDLYFYGDFSSSKTIEIAGCSESTVIWDITDPIHPSSVEFSLESDKALFTASGYREFVAFEPDKVSRKPSAGVAVGNQDIHGMPVPDMVIITPKEYRSAAHSIAALHEETDGFLVHVLEPEQIYNEFSSGSADVGAFRKMLKMWHDRGEEAGHRLGYCLILGRPSYDNKMVTPKVASSGYPRVPIWQSEEGFSESTSFSTDDYIAMLDDCSENGFDITSAKLRVAVGRLPVTSPAEAEGIARKLESYVKTPVFGPWRDNVMIIADDQDYGEHILQAEKAYSLMRGSGNGKHFIFDRLYLDSYPLSYTGTGASYPEAREKMLRKFNESLYIQYIGHAATTSWSHEGLLTWNDIKSISNTNHPFLYAATCSFGQWDADDVSGGETLVLNPESGMIGMIVPSRTVLISLNGLLSNATAPGVFARDIDGKGKRFGDIFINGKNNMQGSDSNKLRYCLISDPALRLPSPSLGIEVRSLAGVDITDMGNEPPVVEALGSFEVEGRILDASGNTAGDFNGVIDLTLFDAERTIETYGNGKEGKEMIYNDRKQVLFKGRTTVNNGLWKTKVLMPSEIDNNFSPALLACYAFSEESGMEANGSTERLYVYGFNDEGIADSEGPVISEFYLNHKGFADGSLVNSTPVAYARFSDPSGINLSDSGIGHKITLKIDGSKSLDDVNSYYTPDASDSESGSVAYPLPELEAGMHELELTVWDNAGNPSTRSIGFNVGVTNAPGIIDLKTDVNPAKTAVVFTVMTDRPMTRLECEIEVFDLSGRKVWSISRTRSSGMDSSMNATWNLTDSSGARVGRGIYLYRAKITGPEGTHSTKTKKLAVAAP